MTDTPDVHSRKGQYLVAHILAKGVVPWRVASLFDADQHVIEGAAFQGPYPPTDEQREQMADIKSPEARALVIDLYNQGFPHHRLGALFDVNIGRISGIVAPFRAAAGVPVTRNMGAAKPPKPKSAAKKKRNKGLSPGALMVFKREAEGK